MTRELRTQVIDKLRNKVAIISGVAQLQRMDHPPSTKDNQRAQTIIRTCDDLLREVEYLLNAELTARPSPDSHLGATGE